MAMSRAGIAILLIPGLMAKGPAMKDHGAPEEKESQEGYRKGGRSRKRRAMGGGIGAPLAEPRLDKRPRSMPNRLAGSRGALNSSAGMIGKPPMVGVPGMKRGGRNPAIAAEAKAEGESYAHEAKEKAEGDDDDEDDREGMRSGGRLTAGERQHLPKSDFALPGKGEGPKGAGSGSYPIPDESHARNALARVSQHGSPAEKETVRRKVHAKYPDISIGG